ncbi:MAG: NUDIX hydrolase [Candidatus Poseidoniaceae archaeon]
MHPEEVVHLEHDGRVLLVDQNGQGPCIPVTGRLTSETLMRLPTRDEIETMGLNWDQLGHTRISWNQSNTLVIKGYPKIAWPKHWALKDDLISDNAVHPVAREAIYRSIHRLVSKVMISNDQNQVLMAKVERGHFRGFWTLPGGYMDHNEHPTTGCVRETKEELGLEIELLDVEPIVTQNIFTDEGISFVSFTYQAHWNGDASTLNVQAEEIAEVRWFEVSEAQNVAVSHFDREALRSL